MGFLKMTPERFWNNTRVNGACVDWLGKPTRKGYGNVGWHGRRLLAHRVAFMLRMGRWPGPHMRHLCNRPICVLHVVEGTQSENEQDKLAAGRNPNASKTHCKYGHEFTPENTYVATSRGGRKCRACTIARSAAMRAVARSAR